MIGNFDYLRSLITPITERFVEANYKLFLVGGVVRDALINEKMSSPDLDLTTDATPDQIRHLVEPLADAVWLQGERFGTIGLKFKDLRSVSFSECSSASSAIHHVSIKLLKYSDNNFASSTLFLNSSTTLNFSLSPTEILISGVEQLLGLSLIHI